MPTPSQIIDLTGDSDVLRPSSINSAAANQRDSNHTPGRSRTNQQPPPRKRKLPFPSSTQHPTRVVKKKTHQHTEGGSIASRRSGENVRVMPVSASASTVNQQPARAPAGPAVEEDDDDGEPPINVRNHTNSNAPFRPAGAVVNNRLPVRISTLRLVLSKSLQSRRFEMALCPSEPTTMPSLGLA